MVCFQSSSDALGLPLYIPSNYVVAIPVVLEREDLMLSSCTNH